MKHEVHWDVPTPKSHPLQRTVQVYRMTILEEKRHFSLDLSSSEFYNVSILTLDQEAKQPHTLIKHLSLGPIILIDISPEGNNQKTILS